MAQDQGMGCHLSQRYGRRIVPRSGDPAEPSALRSRGRWHRRLARLRVGLQELARAWRDDGPHRIEPGYVKLDDAKSPINQSFDGTGIEHTEEFYRFHESGPTAYYSRNKVHVLLSMDLAKSPAMSKPGKNGDMLYMRSDGDIAVAWIRSYGKGRVYYNSMGHMPETMMSKAIMGHVLAAIQFLVGDLDADTTPERQVGGQDRREVRFPHV